jgi:hypothetical protein
MHRLRKVSLVAALLGAYGIANADTLQMDGATAGQDTSRPTRGMTQDRVETEFGNPQARIAPVGDPPISRWEYANFIVYFEYDRVIHAVVKRD